MIEKAIREVVQREMYGSLHEFNVDRFVKKIAERITREFCVREHEPSQLITGGKTQCLGCGMILKPAESTHG